MASTVSTTGKIVASIGISNSLCPVGTKDDNKLPIVREAENLTFEE
jgi:hypothetical protein